MILFVHIISSPHFYLCNCKYVPIKVKKALIFKEYSSKLTKILMITFKYMPNCIPFKGMYNLKTITKCMFKMTDYIG